MALPPFLEGSGREYFNPGLGSVWDVAFLDGQQVPGIVKCVPKTARKVDEANGPGLDAATLRLQGVSAGTFSLVIVVWTQVQIDALDQLLARVAPVAGRTVYAQGKYTTTTTPTPGNPSQKRPASFTFYHPAAFAAGILSIIVEEIEWFGDGPVAQSKQVTLGCKQALPSKKVISGTPQLNAANVAGVADSPKGSGKAAP